jgi:prevent-host-death family protein
LLNAAKPASFVLPQNLRVVFLAFNDDFSPTKVRQESFEVHSDLSNKARHELVIITKHGRDSLVVIAAVEWDRLKWRDRRVGLRLS